MPSSEIAFQPFQPLALVAPVAAPSAAGLAAVIVGLLGAALAALLVAVRGSLAALRASVLFRRWCTWALIGPLFAAAVLVGPVALAALLVFIALQGAREYQRLVEGMSEAGGGAPQGARADRAFAAVRSGAGGP